MQNLQHTPRNRRDWTRVLLRDPFAIRYYSLWHNSFKSGKSPLQDGMPWMSVAAISWLSSHLKPHMHIFEWGSGGSTLFFAHHAQKVISVEHDRAWHSLVKARLDEHQTHNVTLILCDPPKKFEEESLYKSSDPQWQGHSFKEYIEIIDQFPDGYFDVVVVDGRARNGCIAHAIKKVIPGGAILLDNCDRATYELGRQMLSTWRRVHLSGPTPYVSWSTYATIWQKPK